jgi:hypothetical protein
MFRKDIVLYRMVLGNPLVFMSGLDFEVYLKDSAEKATLELREVVSKEHKKDPENDGIYPYEATFTALVFHHLLNSRIRVENTNVESSYGDGTRRRMDLYYFDSEKQEKYCIEVKTILTLTKKRLLREIRDGLAGIRDDISKLKSLKELQNRIIIVAYLGLGIIDDRTFREWKKQVGKHDGITIIFV